MVQKTIENIEYIIINENIVEKYSFNNIVKIDNSILENSIENFLKQLKFVKLIILIKL